MTTDNSGFDSSRESSSDERPRWRWLWRLAPILCQVWGLLFLGAVALRLHRAGLTGALPLLATTVLGCGVVLGGWGFYAAGERRTAGLLWMAYAVAGAGLVSVIGRTDQAQLGPVLFGTLALSGVLALVAGSKRDRKAALAGALAFGLAVVLGAGHDWLDGRLWRAVRSRDLAAVRRLVASGAEVDREEAAGVTPLMAAVEAGDGEIVRVLVAGGASVYGRDARGRSAMMRAVARHDDALAAALLVADRERLDRDVSAGREGK